MLPVVRSARSPMLSVVPVILLTNSVSQRVQLRCEVLEIGPGQRRSPGFVARGAADRDQALLVRDRGIGAEQDAFDPAEDGGVGADAQRQAQNRQQRKSRAAAEQAETEANILQEIFDRMHLTRVAAFLLGLLDAAQRP